MCAFERSEKGMEFYMKDKIKMLYDKDDTIAYKVLLELERELSDSNELYNYFDELLNMLNDEKTFVRVRAFRLICELAKWDTNNKIEKNIDLILNELNDGTSTSVRQCLKKISLLLKYKPELSETIKIKLNKLDLSNYKDSMQFLIRKDIDSILRSI